MSSGHIQCDNNDETADLIACTTTTLNSSGISDMNDVICFISRSTLLSLPVYNTLIFITSQEYSSCHMTAQSSCIMTNTTTQWPSSTQLQAGSLTGNWWMSLTMYTVYYWLNPAPPHSTDGGQQHLTYTDDTWYFHLRYGTSQAAYMFHGSPTLTEAIFDHNEGPECDPPHTLSLVRVICHTSRWVQHVTVIASSALVSLQTVRKCSYLNIIIQSTFVSRDIACRRADTAYQRVWYDIMTAR